VGNGVGGNARLLGMVVYENGLLEYFGTEMRPGRGMR